MVDEELVINKNGNNIKIRCHVLPDDDMRKFGFSDHRDGWWAYWRPILRKFNNIQFMISINKTDPSDYKIDILDDNYGQPYDYQEMMLSMPDFQLPFEIDDGVELLMQELADAGIVSGHVKGEYI